MQIQPRAAAYLASPTISMASTGEFAVAWGELDGSELAPAFRSIQVQRFAADGARIDPGFQAAAAGAAAMPGVPAIALAASGRLLVGWVAWKPGPANDALPVSVQARLFEE